ncbi:hypothetical protein P9112_007640 [Eukaryota sp. TZLM1-RC]
MGVPKFFRFICERYPLILTPVSLDEGAEFDNLFLDFNGVIHSCTHPGDELVPLSERDMFLNIFAYIELLFKATKPRKVVYVAIDGVAPRAKMNQQRSRRFRSAKDAAEAREIKINNGESVPDDLFDTNAITPGTDFMDRLYQHLYYFLVNKTNSDSDWKSVDVILSGCEVPGEGEHKIMDYIRRMKAQPNYSHDQRHCIYGLDADLIFLALVTHEPNFTILREEVVFGPKPANVDSFNPKLQFLHISLVRDYLKAEFETVTPFISFEFNLESIIDDFVFLCMLVGNDFVPSLPTLDIAENSLDLILTTYAKVLPLLDGYLHYAGEINWGRVVVLFRNLVEFEKKVLLDRVEMEKVFRKTVTKVGEDYSTISDDVSSLINQLKVSREETVIVDPISESELDPDDGESDSSDDLIYPTTKETDHASNQSDWKTVERKFGSKNFLAALSKDDNSYRFAYYIDKFGLSSVSEFENVVPNVVRHYCAALVWILGYYYAGVIDWKWFYPYHYAPLLSDLPDYLQDFDFDYTFESNEPFKPLEQLVAVLPRKSGHLLPQPYLELIESGGLLEDYYPEEFEIDMNGKRNPWEGIVIIPFISNEVLVGALNSVNQERLSEELQRRNQIGSPLLISARQPINQSEVSQIALGSEVAPPLGSDSWLFTFKNRSTAIVPYAHPQFPENPVENSGIIKTDGRFLTGCRFAPEINPQSTLHALFPTIYDSEIGFTPSSSQTGSITVFKFASKKPSLMLTINSNTSFPFAIGKGELLSANDFSHLIGKIVFVGWPHIRPALVEKVVDVSLSIYLENNILKAEKTDSSQFLDNWESMTSLLFKRWGINIESDTPKVFILTRRCKSSAPSSEVSSNYVFDRRVLPNIWSTVVTSLPTSYCHVDSSLFLRPLYHRIDMRSVNDLAPGEFGLSLAQGFSFGQLVSLKSVQGNRFYVNAHLPPMVPKKDGKFIKEFIPQHFNLLRVIRKKFPSRMFSIYDAAKLIKCSNDCFNRITGRLVLDNGLKVGLNVRHHFTGARNPEFCAFIERDNRIFWLFTSKCLELIKSYKVVFPELFAYLGSSKGFNTSIPCQSVFKNKKNAKERLKVIEPWLVSNIHPEHHKLIPRYIDVVDRDTVSKIENFMNHLYSVQYHSISEVANPFVSDQGQTVCGLNVTNKVHFELEVNNVLFHRLGNVKLCHYYPHIGDRVVCIEPSGVVPFGTHGVVVAIKQLDKELCDVDYSTKELASMGDVNEDVELDEVLSRAVPLGEMDRVEVEVAWFQVHLGCSTLNDQLSSCCGSRIDVRFLLNLSTPPSIEPFCHGSSSVELVGQEKAKPANRIITQQLMMALSNNEGFQSEPMINPFVKQLKPKIKRRSA